MRLLKGLFIAQLVMCTLLNDSVAAPVEKHLEPCVLEGPDETTVKAFCGHIQVLENRGEGSSSKIISLPITYVPSVTASNEPPLFILRGGPGASNLSRKPIPWLFSKRDFVMVGYRGADGETALNCPNMQAGQLGDGIDLLSKNSKRIFAQGVKECVSYLSSKGWDLSQYTMMQVIEDIEDARKLFGFDKISLISESYGTRVAQIYAYKYPQSIYRSIMIGVNPPGRFIWEPQIIDDQIQYMAELCSQDDYCSSQTPNLAKTIRDVIRDMPSSWLGVPIDSGKVRFLAFNFLFHIDQAAMIYDAFIAAEKGDASGLALLSLAYNLQIKFGDPQPLGDLFAKGIVDHNPKRDYDSEFNLSESIFGSPMSELLMAGGVFWPQAPFPEMYRTPQITTVETLLINGSIDFSTPIQNIQTQLMPYYQNATLVELKEMGHVGDVYFEQPEAISNLVNSFLSHGRVDTSLFVDKEFNFKPSTSLTTIMKWIIAVVGVVVLIFLSIIYFLYQKLKQHRS